jgi:hypothetical protein
MEPFSNATAATPMDSPDLMILCPSHYNTCVDFPVTKMTSNAPLFLQKLLNVIMDKHPRILFYTANDTKINIKDFPK